MMPLTTKTLEFKFHPDRPQQTNLDRWFDTLQMVWNRGLAILEWRQYYRRYQQCLAALTDEQVAAYGFTAIAPTAINIIKSGEDWALCSPIGRDFRLDRTKSWDADNIEFRPCCALIKPHWQQPPPINSYNAIDLRKPFAKKVYDQLGDIPMVYVNDFIGLVLCRAWEAYQKGDRGKPSYKRKRSSDRVNTLVSESFRAQCLLDCNSDRVRLPGLGWINVKGLDERLGRKLAKQRARMRSNPTQYPKLQERLEEGLNYEQVAAWLEQGRSLSADSEDKGIKAAVKQAESLLKKFDRETTIANLREKAADRTLESSIEHLTTPGSFKICRKATGYYLQISIEIDAPKPSNMNHPTGIDIGLNLLYATTTDAKAEHPDQSWEDQRIALLQPLLAKKKPGSRRFKRLQNTINKYQETKHRRKETLHHYHTTWQADRNGFIVVKKFDPKAAIVRPQPVPRANGDGYARNGATDKEIENHAILNASLGGFVAKLEQKSKLRGKQFQRVTVPADANPGEILEAAGFTPPTVVGDGASLNSREELNTARSENPVRESSSNAATPLKLLTQAQAPEIASIAGTPKPTKVKRRNRRKEKTIG